MNTQSLFRYAGIAGLVSIATFFLILVLPAVGGGANSVLAMSLYAVNLLTSIVTLFALYVVHRNESPTISMTAFAAATASSLLSFGADYMNPASPLMLVVTTLYVIAALLYGWLGLRSARLPRGIGVIALVVGSVAAFSAAAALAGAIDLAGMSLMAANLVWVGWFVWLSYYFLTSKPLANAAAQS